MSNEQVPAQAQRMHARLESLGVVDRVRRILLDRDSTRDVSRLICWVVWDRGDQYVKASYMHHRKDPVSGRPTHEHVDFARFNVMYDKPFGPMGSAPLPADVVDQIRAMVARP